MEQDGAQFEGAPDLQAVIALMKERVNTVNELADAAMLFYRQPSPDLALLLQHVTEDVKPALQRLAILYETVEWNKASLSAAMKEVLAVHKLKMPQLAMPLRLLITGQLQTPSIDAVLELFGREVVLARLEKFIK